MKAAADPKGARLQKIEAALADPNKEPAIGYAVGALRRVGLSVEEVAEGGVVKLDAALKAAAMDVTQRMQVKSALIRAGIIG
jgi:hypothetical protein